MSDLTTREQVTETWVAAVAAALVDTGYAFRAGAGSSIEVQSPRFGWMSLHLPGGSPHFDTKLTRDVALSAVSDAVGQLLRGKQARQLVAEYSHNLEGSTNFPAAETAGS